jgi:integrase
LPKLTKRSVDSIQIPKNGERFVWDSQLAGFGLRVRPSGRKSYILQYRNAYGRSRRLTLGSTEVLTPHQARAEAVQLLASVKRGADPAEERKRARHGMTVAELAEVYLRRHLIPKRKPLSVRNFKSELKLRIGPKLGNRKVASLTREDVDRFHRSFSHIPTSANRTLGSLSAMMNHAERMGLRPQGSNPCRYVERYPENRCERFLTPAELSKLGEKIAAAERRGVHPSGILLIRLLALTGMRTGEVQKLKWSEVDFERSCLHLRDSKTGPKRVPLSAPALELLSKAERIEGNPYVCCGPKPGHYLADIYRIWFPIRKAAGLEDVRLHDLRHTFASFGAAAGFGLFVIGKVLGHAQSHTTARYAHLGADPVRLAADAIGRQIAEAMSGTRAETEETPPRREEAS